MKQTIGLALFAFCVAVASATWFGAYLAPPRPPARITTGDTTKALAAPRDSRPTGPDSAARQTAPLPSPAASAAKSAPDTAGAGARAKGVAKILAAMKPKAAAVIMARLRDDEIDQIIRQLNPKQVAALLAALPEERAASVSRRLLGTQSGRQGGT